MPSPSAVYYAAQGENRKSDFPKLRKYIFEKTVKLFAHISGRFFYSVGATNNIRDDSRC